MTLARNNYSQAIFAQELSENTRIAYKKGWESFVEYCAEIGVEPLQAAPQTVSSWMLYLSKTVSANGVKPLHPGTISMYKSGVNKAFEVNGLLSPCKDPLVKATMKICRRENAQPSNAVAPLRDYQVKAMIEACPKTPIGYRDAAILAVGFACALRRSELIALQVADCRFLDEDADQYARMLVTVRQSKTDQAGRGQVIPVINGSNIMPITRLRRHLDASGITDGYLFRTMKRGGSLRGRRTSHVGRATVDQALLEKVRH